MYNFNAKVVTQELIEWIRNWFNENGPESPAVIGISGGKDSTIVTALCIKALGKDRVFGVLMPNGEQADIATSWKIVKYFGIKHVCVNIENAVYGVLSSIKSGDYNHTCEPIEISNQTMFNLPPRIRMSTLYAISQSMNGRVSNNCNLSEDWVGYSTIFGDSVGDFSPLSSLTVAEVKQVGRELGLPNEFIDKVPSDGLCGKTDEDNLGFSYEVLDKYIRTNVCEDENIKALIDRKHNANLFKLQPMKKYVPNDNLIYS